MKEQFVTYEIASKLKELGFGMDDYLQLPFYYDKEGNLHLMEVWVSKKYNPSPNHLGTDTIDDFDAKIGWVDNSLDEIYLAPLWQQVIDWFRDKHNIHISIKSDLARITAYQYIIATDYILNEYGIMNDSYYQVRKQAILKAIELCKNN